jgi:hypothetical protein
LQAGIRNAGKKKPEQSAVSGFFFSLNLLVADPVNSSQDGNNDQGKNRRGVYRAVVVLVLSMIGHWHTPCYFDCLRHTSKNKAMYARQLGKLLAFKTSQGASTTAKVMF